MNPTEVFNSTRVYEAETTKGAKQYLIFAKMQNGFVYFVQSGYNKNTGRAKVIKQTFDYVLRAIEQGDIVPVPRDKVDIQKITAAALGLTAMSKGVSVEQYIDEKLKGNL